MKMKKKQDTYVRVDFQSVGVLITPMQKVYAVHVLIKKNLLICNICYAKRHLLKVRRYLFLVPELRDSLWSRKSSQLFLETSKLKLQKCFTFCHIVRPLPSFKFACKILQKGACQVYNWLWSRDFFRWHFNQ